jgi:hypothetical protein
VTAPRNQAFPASPAMLHTARSPEAEDKSQRSEPTSTPNMWNQKRRQLGKTGSAE